MFSLSFLLFWQFAKDSFRPIVAVCFEYIPILGARKTLGYRLLAASVCSVHISISGALSNIHLACLWILFN